MNCVCVWALVRHNVYLAKMKSHRHSSQSAFQAMARTKTHQRNNNNNNNIITEKLSQMYVQNCWLILSSKRSIELQWVKWSDWVKYIYIYFYVVSLQLYCLTTLMNRRRWIFAYAFIYLGRARVFFPRRLSHLRTKWDEEKILELNDTLCAIAYRKLHIPLHWPKWIFGFHAFSYSLQHFWHWLWSNERTISKTY